MYDANYAKWKRCRDSNEGGDAVKSSGKDYLPKPGGFDDEEYANYLLRALYYEAVGRTVSGFTGAIARKDPIIDIPAQLQPLVDDATANGLSLDELIKTLCSETILTGRVGVLVDYDEKMARCYLVPYLVESIVNWADELVVLNETVYERDPDDRFKMVAIEQYRQLWMDDGAYTVTVWRKLKTEDNKPADWAVYSTIVPKRVGKALEAIPFHWLTPMGKTAAVARPPLLGLVDVCMAHYRNSADLEWGLHFSGLPTLYVTGSMPTDEPVRAGSTAAIMIENPAAKVGYAEFDGDGLGSLERQMESKERMMAVLGASVFSQEKNGVESEGTTRIRKSGETNLLVGVVVSVEETIKAALECAAEWMGIAGEVEVTLNRDFIADTIDGPTLTAMVAAVQAGAMSLNTFTYALEQGDILPPDTDIDTEVAALEVVAKAKADEAIRVAKESKPTLKPTA